MNQSLSGRTTVVAASDQVACDLGGQTAILNLASGVYYGLDATGTFVWNLIDRPRTVDDLREALLQEYDVERERCERDLLTLLQELSAEGLIEIVDAPAR
jgi:hypothetical protein